MPKDGFKSVTMHTSVYDVISKIAQDKDMPTATYVENMMEYIMEKQNPPYMRFGVARVNDTIYVIDAQRDELCRMNIKHKSIRCVRCKRDNCMHVGALIGLLPLKYNVVKK